MGAILSAPLSDFVFPFGAAQILRHLADMVRTGRQPSDFSVMVEAVRIGEAARAAHQSTRGVEIPQNPIQLMKPTKRSRLLRPDRLTIRPGIAKRIGQMANP